MRDPEIVRQTLEKLFSQYNTHNLSGISSEELKQEITSKIGVIDTELENYSPDELDYQRDLSIKFHWGHNHDFGDFKIAGRMEDRHIDVMTNFISLFPITINNFLDKTVFDIGCWTGGTALMLASLGSRVTAIEEVVKYAQTAEMLCNHFGLEKHIQVISKSLYQCNSKQLLNRFDIVHFPGVIYHLSDPILALRILFNSLKIGGKILIESEGIDHPEPFCRFDGASIITQGSKKEMNRGGWNWFLPSPSALDRMLREVGFENVETVMHKQSRVYGYGEKIAHHGICKAGLSVTEIT
ncbi:MAG: DUF1698 domain-containing protein [Endozoicomonadaceae bacterium]|nr:DUF1698 domain-containing protein [Endozoicomonadaceae bacterium]